MKTLCGPKILRGIMEPCDGFCCGVGKDGNPDLELTERVNRRADGWRRAVGAINHYAPWPIAYNRNGAMENIDAARASKLETGRHLDNLPLRR
jgi:hypothetical protein